MIRPQQLRSSRHGRQLLATSAPGGAALLACVLLAGCGGGGSAAQSSSAAAASSPPPAASGTPSAPATPATSGSVAQPAGGPFSTPLAVTNPLFPLAAGSQFTYEGKIVDSDGTHEHSVVFTVTDLVKHVDGTETVVALDQDYLEGQLQEQELAFFAQDTAGNVWNFGEYPEEYDNGKLSGAPSTWIRGAAGAYGGMHVLSQPRIGMQYREGLVPAIQFDDVSKVISVSQRTCEKAGCYNSVVVVDETSPNDPTSGHQIKYYAPGTGLVKVAAKGGDTQEFLPTSATPVSATLASARPTRAPCAMASTSLRCTDGSS
jgi:hypothetical protein